MSHIIDSLRSFNSKERFFLVGQILGNPEFLPCPTFREQLGEALGLEIPETVFSAMDYHLDWLYAALRVATDNREEAVYSNSERIVKAQQEDMDFLIAFDAVGVCHIVLIEAKGVTGWTNSQMKSKANRLRAILGEDGKKWPGVQPHFVLMSASAPQRLDASMWPQWMTRPDGGVAWIELCIPVDLRSVSRCNADRRKDIHGECWSVFLRRGPDSQSPKADPAG